MATGINWTKKFGNNAKGAFGTFSTKKSVLRTLHIIRKLLQPET
jgi:hypothetical protein